MSNARQATAAVCHRHPEQQASFSCESCGNTLCEECVRVGTHLIFCGLCGERALPLPGVSKTETVPLAERQVTVYRSRERVATGELGQIVAEHLVIPLAIFAMVFSLLLYLLELRALLFGEIRALRWIGFWFVAATVLIARYGRSGGDQDRRQAYSGCLAMATFLALLLRSGSPGAVIFHLVMVAAVWRFAASLTNRLSLEPEPESLDQLLAERREPRRNEEGSGWARWLGKGQDAHGNPSRGVAVLALFALALFVIGDSWIRQAVSSVRDRALAEVAVFLLATGLVLAAGSTIGSLRHARRRGAEVPAGLILTRLFSAALVAVLALALATQIPGTRYHSRAGQPEGRWVASHASAPQAAAARDTGVQQEQSGPPDSETAERGQGRREAGQDQSGDSSSEQNQQNRSGGGMAPSLLGQLSGLGRLLWLPVVIIMAAVGLYWLGRWLMAWRLHASAWSSFWQQLLERLRQLFARQGGANVEPETLEEAPRPESLAQLPVREAILAAYRGWLIVLDGLGHQRDDDATPYEILRSLPKRLAPCRPGAQQLTELFVLAAYGPGAPDERDAERAKAAYGQLYRLRQS